VFPKKSPNTSEIIADSFIRIFIDGPDVSFSGSPTVSPTTAALCGSVFFLKGSPFSSKLPASIYFFALSQAPPVFEKEIAI